MGVLTSVGCMRPVREESLPLIVREAKAAEADEAEEADEASVTLGELAERAAVVERAAAAERAKRAAKTAATSRCLRMLVHVHVVDPSDEVANYKSDDEKVKKCAAVSNAEHDCMMVATTSAAIDACWASASAEECTLVYRRRQQDVAEGMLGMSLDAWLKSCAETASHAYTDCLLTADGVVAMNACKQPIYP